MLGLRFPKMKIRAGGNPASAAGGPSLTTPLSPMRPLQTRLHASATAGRGRLPRGTGASTTHLHTEKSSLVTIS